MANSNLKRWTLILSLALALGASARPAVATGWPSRTVTVVVPYAAGGNTDFMARLTAEYLHRAFGQPFVVENRGGAGGTIAANYVAHRPADGYTLFFGTISQISIAPFIYKIHYDPIKDFVPIANVGANPYVIAVRPDDHFKSLADLVTYARLHPGKLTVGHAGAGSMSHLSASVFLHRAGISGTMIAYKGGGPAMIDLMGGVIDMYSANVSEILPHINGGRVNFLGVSSEKRISQLPNVPTIADSYPGQAIETWNGLLGPAGMPAGVVDKLAFEVTKLLSSADFQARLKGAGITPQIGEVKNVFAQRIQKDIIFWKPEIEQIGIKPE